MYKRQPLYIPPFHLDARFGSRVAHLASSVLHRYGLVVRSGRYTAQNQQREIARIPKQLVCDSQCRLPCSQRDVYKRQVLSIATVFVSHNGQQSSVSEIKDIVNTEAPAALPGFETPATGNNAAPAQEAPVQEAPAN